VTLDATWWQGAALVAFAFLLGSIPFGVVLARARGIDLKRVGSGNIGATNAARALGKKAGVLVLVLDTAKAFLPTFAAQLWFAGGRGQWIAAAVGLAAFLGHIFSPWLGWKGGKGVACGLGTFLALTPAGAGVAALVCALVVLVTRVGSLGSLIASAALMPTLWLRHEPRPYFWLSVVMFVLVLWRHRENLERLRRGTENKV
jgi:glycerol-3-phosphate acyltransferase PlsY